MDWNRWARGHKGEKARTALAKRLGVSCRLVYFWASGERTFRMKHKVKAATEFPELRLPLLEELGWLEQGYY